MLRFFCLISLILMTGTLVFAEEESNLNKDTRAATGGAQTLEDILARQRGEEVNYDFRQNALGNKDASVSLSLIHI